MLAWKCCKGPCRESLRSSSLARPDRCACEGDARSESGQALQHARNSFALLYTAAKVLTCKVGKASAAGPA